MGDYSGLIQELQDEFTYFRHRCICGTDFCKLGTLYLYKIKDSQGSYFKFPKDEKYPKVTKAWLKNINKVSYKLKNRNTEKISKLHFHLDDIKTSNDGSYKFYKKGHIGDDQFLHTTAPLNYGRKKKIDVTIIAPTATKEQMKDLLVKRGLKSLNPSARKRKMPSHMNEESKKQKQSTTRIQETEDDFGSQ